MPFAATEMYLEIIIPSEESHTEKERYPMAALTCRLQREMIQVNLRTKQKQAHRPENELTVPRGKGGGRDSRGVWDGHGHTAVFNMENQQGPAVQHRGLCSMSRGSLDGRGVWGRMDTCMAESLCCPAETVINRLYPNAK